MMWCRPGRIIKGQPGFTLIETVVALALTSIIGLGAAMATVQVINQGSRNSDYTTASRHTMNAIFWISRDAQMSQTVAPAIGSGFPLTLSWTEWDSSQHAVTYSIVSGTLRRSHSVDGGPPNQTLVAQYITTADNSTSCGFADRVLTVQVTTTVGEGAHALSVTKLREITPRPGL